MNRHKLLMWFLLGIGSWIVACQATPPAPAPTVEAEPTAAAATTPAAQTAAQSDRSKTVIFNTVDGPVKEVDNWNPIANWRRDQGLQQAMMEPLFILNYETGQTEPWLGESMTPNDKLDVWTLKLRPGVLWSDDVPFTAEDVVFTVNTLLKGAPDLVYSGDLATWVDKVEKVDDLTVKFTLKTANPRFQQDYWSVRLWSGVNIVPAHIWKDQDPKTFKNYDPAKGWPVFTGPYLLEKASEKEMVYKRNDNWWGAKAGWKPLPRPEKLIWRAFDGEAEQVAAMKAGELDSAFDISLESLLALKKDNPKIISHFDDLPYAWVPDPCVRTLEFNHASPPWDDKEMRWAVNYAIDRNEVVAFAYNGTTFAARHFFPSYPPLNRYVNLLEKQGLYDKYPLLEYNPNKAKAIFEAKGWKLNAAGIYEKDGKELTLNFLTRKTLAEALRASEVVAEQLKRIGINVKAEVQDVATWTDNISSSKFDLTHSNGACGSATEPWVSMDMFSTRWAKPLSEKTQQGQNIWHWSGQPADEYSALVEQIGSLPLNDPQIDDLFVQAMTIWLDELPIIPLNQTKFIDPFDTTYWTGWPTSKNNYIHPVTWWQTSHIIIHRLEPAQP